MKNKNGRKLPWTLMALGAALALWALAMLAATPDVLQYSVVAPAPGEKGEKIAELTTSARQALADMADSVSAGTLGGVKATVSLTAGGNTREATLFAMGEGWLEVYPRVLRTGRRISETELRQGAKAIMLDEDLAFQLFGTELPENAKVSMGGADYAVVGTVKHAGSLTGGRGVGDLRPYDCYVPLAGLPEGLRLDTLTLSAKPVNASGAAQLFAETVQSQWMEEGTLINLSKEAMRRTILLRVLLLIVGLYALVGLFRRMTALCGRWAADFRARLSRQYIGRLMPRLIGLILLGLLSYAALIALAWLLMDFSARPLYVFTEWVPENIVEWSSLTKVFWNLTADAAALVRVETREMRTLAFWGAMARWGTMLFLTGAALLRLTTSYKSNDAKGNSLNQNG